MFRAILILLVVIVSGLSFATAAPAKPSKSKPSDSTQTTDPMRIAIIRDNMRNCEPNCAEWIMMQGDIVPASVPLFKRVLKLAGKRKLPLLIHSRGGKVEAGFALGRLIRANHLEVTVGKTVLQPCDPNDKSCSDKALTGRIGAPQSYAAECASSCAFLLAAGEKRHVPDYTYVGVHQFTNYLTTIRYMNTYLRRRAMVNGRVVILSQKLVKQRIISQTTRKTDTPKATYDRAARYFAEMGIGDGINTIIQSTPADDIHWLKHDELVSTNLMTDNQNGSTQFAAITAAAKAATMAAAPNTPAPPAAAPAAQVAALPVPSRTLPTNVQRGKTYVSADSYIPLGRYGNADVVVDVTIHHRLGTPMVSIDFTPRNTAGLVPTTDLVAAVQIGTQPWRESQKTVSPGPSLSLDVPVAEFCALQQTDALGLSLKAAPGGQFEEGKIVIQTESRFMTAHAILPDICSQMQATK